MSMSKKMHNPSGKEGKTPKYTISLQECLRLIEQKQTKKLKHCHVDARGLELFDFTLPECKVLSIDLSNRVMCRVEISCQATFVTISQACLQQVKLRVKAKEIDLVGSYLSNCRFHKCEIEKMQWHESWVKSSTFSQTPVWGLKEALCNIDCSYKKLVVKPQILLSSQTVTVSDENISQKRKSHGTAKSKNYPKREPKSLGYSPNQPDPQHVERIVAEDSMQRDGWPTQAQLQY